MTAEQVLAAVEHRLSLSATSGSRTAATSHIRTFLRFLYWAGRHHQDLACIVPRTSSWRLAHLPPRLAWDDVRHAIDAIGATTPVDIRDRAVLLLLATTGIRNGELRAIRLRDIDWHTGEVFVRRTKGKRDRMVPLLEETGAALADYILRARPKVDSPYLFLSFTPPVGPFKCAAPVSRIVRKRLRHGGVELGRVAGAHLLRHSLATQLVGQRRPINEVADLLGHRSINITALYVRLRPRSSPRSHSPFRERGMTVFARFLGEKAERYIELRQSLGYSFSKQAGTLRAFVRYVERAQLDAPATRTMRWTSSCRSAVPPTAAPLVTARSADSTRTFGDWNDPPPGYVEVDFVAHSGTSSSGSFVQTMVLTDLATGWTECVPVRTRESVLVIAAIKSARSLFPFSLLGVDVDNDTAFMNELAVSWCRSKGRN